MPNRSQASHVVVPIARELLLANTVCHADEAVRGSPPVALCIADKCSSVRCATRKKIHIGLKLSAASHQCTPSHRRWRSQTIRRGTSPNIEAAAGILM